MIFQFFSEICSLFNEFCLSSEVTVEVANTFRLMCISDIVLVSKCCYEVPCFILGIMLKFVWKLLENICRLDKISVLHKSCREFFFKCHTLSNACKISMLVQMQNFFFETLINNFHSCMYLCDSSYTKTKLMFLE